MFEGFGIEGEGEGEVRVSEEIGGRVSGCGLCRSIIFIHFVMHKLYFDPPPCTYPYHLLV